MRASGTSAKEDNAKCEGAETPEPDEGRRALEPPFDETPKASAPQPDQGGSSAELKDPDGAHEYRGTAVWCCNHEDRPCNDADHECHGKADKQTMAIQEAHEHGWCDDAEQTDPRDGETDQRDEKRKNFVHALHHHWVARAVPVPAPPKGE